MKDKHLIIVMIAVALFFGVASPVIGLLGSCGVIENRLVTKNLYVTGKVYGEDVPLSGVFNAAEDVKTDIRNIYSNCIPFYSAIVSSVQKAELNLLNFSDGVLQTLLEETEPEEEPIPTGESESETVPDENDAPVLLEEPEPEEEKIVYTASRLLAGRPNYFSIEPLKTLERLEGASDKELEKLMDRQLNYLDRLVQAAPDLNYYCYMGTRIQEADFYSDIVKNPKSTAVYFKTFVEELNDKYTFDYLRLDKPEDRVNKLYRTDHHWNMFGAYEGYQQIINMMYANTPEIGEPVEYDIVKVDGLQWFGSMAGATGFSNRDYLDDFYVLDLKDFPDHIAGNGYKIQRTNDAYLKGRYPTGNLYYDYYGGYYPPQPSYEFPDNHTGRNLLLIGDSYSWSVGPIIAAHFDKTVCYNTPWMIADSVKYDYRQVIEDNDITDVLVLLYSSRLLFGYDGTDFDNFLDH